VARARLGVSGRLVTRDEQQSKGDGDGDGDSPAIATVFSHDDWKESR
jgi:hypothetical protein